MSETLEQFILRRRGELDQEASALHTQLRVIEAEREKVDKVAMMFAEDPMPGPPTPTSEWSVNLARVDNLHRAERARRVSEATIKEMVIDILDKEDGDLTALAILDQINRRTGIDYPRTSLSPQLSRLKAEGKIHREGRYWSLGQDPGDGLDDDNQHEDGDGEQAEPTVSNNSALHPENLSPEMDAGPLLKTG